ncbi:MAG: serine O-acetyltransferase [Saprospiraceae bacterium]
MRDEFLDKIFKQHQSCKSCPSKREVSDFFVNLLGVLYADYSDQEISSREAIDVNLKQLKLDLEALIGGTVSDINSDQNKSKIFFNRLENIYDALNKDVDAINMGDPAAKNRREVIRSYPGFYAIAAYRIANEMHNLNVVDLPRIITEHAHSQTGIDIHPAATIGEYFCIDHGTGIVIGATTEIGKNVKIYQGVTLGALSVDKKDANNKRHPTIENGVVIYAGATILGGETVIGANSIIGGNVWLTKSVAPNTKVYYQARMSSDKYEIENCDESDIHIFKEYNK